MRDARGTIGACRLTSPSRRASSSSRTTTCCGAGWRARSVERGFEVREAADADEARGRGPAATRPNSRSSISAWASRSGLDVVRDLVELDPATAIVVLTGYGSIATALEAVRLGATHYLTKPADVDDDPGRVRRATRARRTRAPRCPVVRGDARLARVEWEHINRVLSDCGGNVSQAARLLGIHRRSLQRKLAKYPTPR